MSDPNKRILFVESKEAPQDTFTRNLKPKENGWIPSFASSALEALELVQNNPYDIIISANNLPDQSGVGLFELIKESHPESIRFLLIDESEKKRMRSQVNSAQQVLLNPLELKPFVKQVNRAFALRSITHDPALLKLLGDTNALPPLPRVFQELTAALDNPNSSLGDVADIISKDIAISAKILALANSALFTLRAPATTIPHAVSLLGSGLICSLVFSQGMGDSFATDAESEKFIEELNRHSIECASVTSRILSHWGASRELTEKAVFCGIAHDIGKLVLAKFAPEKWSEVLAAIKSEEQTDIEAERSIIGVSHCEVAAYLLGIWGFPNDQILAIAFHHEPERVQEHELGILCALHLAEYYCSSEKNRTDLNWEYLKDCRLEGKDVALLLAMLDDPEEQ